MYALTRKEEEILLAVYHLGDSAYLIPIQAEIQRFTGKHYAVGTIYAPLNRLYMNGLLQSHFLKKTGPASGKPIKCYRLTQEGIMALQALQRQRRLMWDGVKLS